MEVLSKITAFYKNYFLKKPQIENIFKNKNDKASLMIIIFLSVNMLMLNKESGGETMDHKNMDLTEGTIWKQLLIFFFPIMIGTFFQQLYNTIDTIIVGQYVGTNALAAVGSTGNLTNLLVQFFVGLSSGATVVIAQFYGAKDTKNVSKAVHTSFALSLASGIVMTIFGVFFSKVCLNLIGVPSEILNDSSLYMRLYFTGMIPAVLYNIGAGILRAVGDSRTPLYYLVICCIINVVFDYLFVVNFQLGIKGAAIATVVAQLICAILVCRKLIFTKDCYQLVIRQIAFDMPILKKIITIGIPAGLQSTMYSVSNIVLQTRINTFGTNTIASWAVYGKIDALFWMISGAFGASITTFVGQNYGAQLFDRIKQGMKTCLLMFLGVSAVISGLLMVFGNTITSFFSSDILIIKECTGIIHLLTPYYFTFCCVEVFSGSMRGCGDSIKPMILVCCGVCVLRILWVLFVSPFFTSFYMVIISYPITWAITSLLFMLYYQKFKKIYFQ